MGTYFERVRKLFLKNTIDFNRSDITLNNFHPQLFAALATNGVFINKKKSFFRLFCTFLDVSIAITGIVLELMTVLHFVGINDYSFATEPFCYATLNIGIIAVATSMFFNYNDKRKLLEQMNHDFKYICELESKYRLSFLNGQLLIRMSCAAWTFVVLIVGGLYLIMPLGILCYRGLFPSNDRHTQRPLPYPVWLPHDDPYSTPNYEMILIFQLFNVMAFIQSYSVYIYVLFHILLHQYIMMDVIILQLEALFEGLDESVTLLPRNHPRRMETQCILNKRIDSIVKVHVNVLQTVKTLARVFGSPLVFQVLCSSIVLCLTAFQFEAKLVNGKFDVLFFILTPTSALQLWISCYLGSITKYKAHEIGDACWSSGWHQTRLSQLVRSDLLIIILRAQQPVTIKFSGLPGLELDTFSLLMTRAYSYFNLLRQYR